MGRICAVEGCRTGYKHVGNIDGVTIHKFPINESKKDLWLIQIGRTGFQPSDNVGVCSKHFRPEDFVVKSTDKNPRRKRNTFLQKRYLKNNAIPTIFTGATNISNNTRRSGNATSTARLHREQVSNEKQRVKFTNDDYLEGLSNLTLRLESDPWIINYTSDWAKVFTEKYIQLIIIDRKPDGFCRILSSLYIDQNLEVSVTANDSIISPFSYRHLVSNENKLTLYSQFLNFLPYLKSFDDSYTEHSLSEEVERATSSLLDYIRKGSFDDLLQTRFEFLCEQLQLLTVESNFQKRYSPNLITTSYLLYFSSPSAYRVLRSAGILTLPSVRHLQIITKLISKRT